MEMEMKTRQAMRGGWESDEWFIILPLGELQSIPETSHNNLNNDLLMGWGEGVEQGHVTDLLPATQQTTNYAVESSNSACTVYSLAPKVSFI